MGSIWLILFLGIGHILIGFIGGFEAGLIAKGAGKRIIVGLYQAYLEE